MKHSVKNIISRDLQQGFTLLEVLIAVLVFSFGLLGIAGMMTISVRNNHNGYLRSQANFMAENMVDRMRANPSALWGGSYAGLATTGTATCDLAVPCTFNELAAFDMQSWAASLAQLLPAGQGTINCVPNAALPGVLPTANPPSIWAPSPPYSGICTVSVQWNESNEVSGQELQTLTLVGQP